MVDASPGLPRDREPGHVHHDLSADLCRDEPFQLVRVGTTSGSTSQASQKCEYCIRFIGGAAGLKTCVRHDRPAADRLQAYTTRQIVSEGAGEDLIFIEDR